MAATPARDRLLAAANDLFYREGVHTVGIDRVIAEAGVAKASLYNTFGSKDELIRAYLEARHAAIVERVGRALAAYDAPRDKLLGVFAYQADLYRRPDYRGCPFARPAPRRRRAARPWRRRRVPRLAARRCSSELATEAGARRPARRWPPAPSALRRRRHLRPRRPRPRRLGGGQSGGGRPDRQRGAGHYLTGGARARRRRPTSPTTVSAVGPLARRRPCQMGRAPRSLPSGP